MLKRRNFIQSFIFPKLVTQFEICRFGQCAAKAVYCRLPRRKHMIPARVFHSTFSTLKKIMFCVEKLKAWLLYDRHIYMPKTGSYGVLRGLFMFYIHAWLRNFRLHFHFDVVGKKAILFTIGILVTFFHAGTRRSSSRNMLLPLCFSDVA